MSPVRMPSRGVRLALQSSGSRFFQAQWRFLMTHSHRDDAPADFSIFRRKILIGAGVVLGGLATAPIVTIAADSAGSAYPGQFLEISALLIPHRLDRDGGLRWAAALGKEDPT